MIRGAARAIARRVMTPEQLWELDNIPRETLLARREERELTRQAGLRVKAHALANKYGVRVRYEIAGGCSLVTDIDVNIQFYKQEELDRSEKHIQERLGRTIKES